MTFDAYDRSVDLLRTLAPLLQSLTASMPPQAQSAADLVRSMRDGDR
jgi:hypothetical protein